MNIQISGEICLYDDIITVDLYRALETYTL